ncbi:MAG: valine--tRNA ligase [Bacilli bacterium]|nr:valine--tRNA ligase [Bacilli bacterium]
MLEKKIDFVKVSEGKYDFWLKEKFFSTHVKNKPPFSIVLPPPNITGKLHLGHALDTVLSDIIIRYKQANGFDTVWIPGMDHAGIATQTKLIDFLKTKGINWRLLGRKKFLEEAWEWKKTYADIIRSQWKLLGLSLDYSQERFTLDEDLNRCVNKVFVNLYNKNLIYRGERIINWDITLKTALSDVEVLYKKEKGNLYYFKYFLDGTKIFLPVATTRPETIFGDTAIVVNPNDKRYKKYIGQYCLNPINNKKLIIIGDKYVDINFGSGVLKCTPAHDKNDFELSIKNKLDKINIMNEDGTMNENAAFCEGLDRNLCRKKVVHFLKKNNFLLKIEKITHQVAYSERSDTVIEPRLSKQWFVKMKELAKKVIDLQNSDNKIIFFPNMFSKKLLEWAKNVNDWCISRQLWWGHQIPVYYKRNTNDFIVCELPPKDLENYYQDEDVLDTWFSSSLWPFTSLHWPKNDYYYDRYFPTSLLVTGYDLIFFWIFRMIVQSLEHTKKPPFLGCLIHGLIRDQNNRKMSKSMGNGVDPVDVINKYGIDSLRYFLSANSTPGLDISFQEQKIIAGFNFLNKIWNSARYVLNIIGSDFCEQEIIFENLSTIDKYVISMLQKTIQKMTVNNDKYRFHISLHALYSFVYDDFCSFYLETSKINRDNETTKQVLFFILKNIVFLIYPFCPFIAEELYQNMPHSKKSIMQEDYPKYQADLVLKKSVSDVLLIKEIIKDIRNIKTTNKIQPNHPVNIDIYTTEKLFDGFLECLSHFVFAKNVQVFKDKYQRADNDKKIVLQYAKISLSVDLQIDKDNVKKMLIKNLEEINKSIQRSEKLLNNKKFLEKADKQKVIEEKTKYSEKILTRTKILARINEIK